MLKSKLDQNDGTFLDSQVIDLPFVHPIQLKQIASLCIFLQFKSIQYKQQNFQNSRTMFAQLSNQLVTNKLDTSPQSNSDILANKVVNNRGYLIVFVQNIQTIIANIFDKVEEFLLDIKINEINKTSSKLYRKGKMIEVEQNFTYIAQDGDKIKFELKNAKTLESLAYCEFPIHKFFVIPRVRHCIQIDLVNNKKLKEEKTAQKAATLVVQILHLNENIGTLELTLVSASLDRDTEIVGKMDPYALVKSGSQTYKTKVAKNAGRHPTWNEKFIIPIKQADSLLEVAIYDEDTFKDDAVGSVRIDLLGSNFLDPSNKPKTQSLSIKTENDQRAGSIKFQYKFFINQT